MNLAELSARLGYPSRRKLEQSARARGIEPGEPEPVTELFAPPRRKTKSHAISTKPWDRVQADLIDYANTSWWSSTSAPALSS